ncbi:MAG TPA: DUF1178 family protein [Aestuariivirgaceae bacterium]|jgi:hypothetical protein
MIHYDLKCKAGHVFDGWFQNSAAYDEQRQKEVVRCPSCGTHEVDKQVMKPGIPRKSNKKDEGRKQVFSAGADPRAKSLIEKMRELRQHVESHADYVGDQFADEARRIHYKETEERGIYGEATAEEARSLIEEGIEVQPLPVLPEDRN